MSFFSSVLVGKELIKQVQRGTKPWGYVNGFVHNGVAGVLSVEIDGKDESSFASLTIAKHRFFLTNYKNHEFQWALVGKQVIKLFEEEIVVDFSECQSYFPTDLNAVLSEKDELNLLLVCSETTDGNTVFVHSRESASFIR